MRHSIPTLARRGLLLLLVAAISACASSFPHATTEQVNDRRVEYALVVHDNTVPVVFENGLMAKFTDWAQVFPAIAQDTTAFAYNRPGYGASDAVTTPRDGAHIVDELRALLRSKGLKPPYVLVGHSVGGLYMQLFARRYPDEVYGLVLVDATHPEQFKGKGAPENWPPLVRAGFAAIRSAVETQEFNALTSTGDSVLALPPFTGKPVVVLSAAKPLQEKSEFADDANAKRKDIARLHPGSRQVFVDSGHNMQREKPEAVVAAIREVLAPHH